MSDETVEEFGEALRQIHIFLSGMDPSDGEGTSGDDVLLMVKSVAGYQAVLLAEAMTTLTGFGKHGLAEKIRQHLETLPDECTNYDPKEDHAT